jgi:hypothetical protein
VKKKIKTVVNSKKRMVITSVSDKMLINPSSNLASLGKRTSIMSLHSREINLTEASKERRIKDGPIKSDYVKNIKHSDTELITIRSDMIYLDKSSKDIKAKNGITHKRQISNNQLKDENSSFQSSPAISHITSKRNSVNYNIGSISNKFK